MFRVAARTLYRNISKDWRGNLESVGARTTATQLLEGGSGRSLPTAAIMIPMAQKELYFPPHEKLEPILSYEDDFEFDDDSVVPVRLRSLSLPTSLDAVFTRNPVAVATAATASRRTSGRDADLEFDEFDSVTEMAEPEVVEIPSENSAEYSSAYVSHDVDTLDPHHWSNTYTQGSYEPVAGAAEEPVRPEDLADDAELDTDQF